MKTSFRILGWVCAIISIFFCSLFVFKYYCLKNQPIKMYHPVLPDWIDEGIRVMDRFTCFTAGITWYVAKDRDGIEYLINFENHTGCIWIRQRYNKDKWHKISNRDYSYKFDFYDLVECKFNKGIFKKGHMK